VTCVFPKKENILKYIKQMDVYITLYVLAEVAELKDSMSIKMGVASTGKL